MVPNLFVENRSSTSRPGEIDLLHRPPILQSMSPSKIAFRVGNRSVPVLGIQVQKSQRFAQKGCRNCIAREYHWKPTSPCQGGTGHLNVKQWANTHPLASNDVSAIQVPCNLNHKFQRQGTYDVEPNMVRPFLVSRSVRVRPMLSVSARRLPSRIEAKSEDIRDMTGLWPSWR